MSSNTLPARIPYQPAALAPYRVDESQWKVLTEAIFPTAKTAAAVEMALAYCKARNLDIMKKPVHVVPMWSSEKNGYVETVWPGISEIRTTAFRTKQYAGIDEAVFGPDREETFSGKTKNGPIEKTITFPEWCKVVVHRVLDGKVYSFTGPKTYWTESYARIGNTDVPNDMWAKRPRSQLEKVAEAAALRRAFPEEIGNDYAAEEMEGQLHGDPNEVTVSAAPAALTPPPPPSQQLEHKPAEQERKPEPEKPAEDKAATRGKGKKAEDKAPEISAEDRKFLDDMEAEFKRCVSREQLQAAAANFRPEYDKKPAHIQDAAGALWRTYDTAIQEKARLERLKAEAAEKDGSATSPSEESSGGPGSEQTEQGPHDGETQEEHAERMRGAFSLGTKARTAEKPRTPAGDDSDERSAWGRGWDDADRRIKEHAAANAPSDGGDPAEDEKPAESDAPALTPEQEALLDTGREKAMGGLRRLNLWLRSRSTDDIKFLKDHEASLIAAAEAADAAKKD